MPELPEVETIRRDLQKIFIRDSLRSLEVADARLMSPAEAARWPAQTYHQSWDRIERQGKYLRIVLSNGWKIVFHLRMTGHFMIDSAATGGYRLRLTFSSGRRLDFCDPRRFGEVWLLDPQAAGPSKTPLGPDALTELTQDQFVTLLKRRPTRIQPLLMDQSRLAGVGNIYAQEALFKAMIRPSRSAKRVTHAEAKTLFTALQDTLKQAIDHRGSTSRNYRDAFGKSGHAQTLHAVYRRGGQPCLRCERPLRSARVGGRGTVYCLQCQK